MALHHSPRIVTNGLVLCLDAGSRKSYGGTGNVWRDLAGSNNGTLTNGPTFNSANGGSIVFDGVDDYINIGDSPSIRFGTNNFTWAVWLKAPNSNLSGTIIGKRDVGSYPMILLAVGTLNGTGGGIGDLASKKISFILRLDDSNQYVGTTDNDIIDGNWKYVVMVRNSGGLQIFSNGINQNFTTIYNVGTGVNSNISLINVKCFIGAATDGAGAEAGAVSFLNSNIVFVQMYNRALTPAEIQQNYNATKGRFKL